LQGAKNGTDNEFLASAQVGQKAKARREHQTGIVK
jgi:hypothetical protein